MVEEKALSTNDLLHKFEEALATLEKDLVFAIKERISKQLRDLQLMVQQVIVQPSVVNMAMKEASLQPLGQVWIRREF